VGSPVTFSVIATAIGDMTYQWTFAGVNIPTATNSTYTIPSAQSTNEGNYRVRVRNPAGAQTSPSATLTVVPIPSLTSPEALSNAFKAFLSSGRSNIYYRIEYTTNFTNWSLLSTIKYTNTPVPFTDPARTNTQIRYYRAKVQ